MAVAEKKVNPLVTLRASLVEKLGEGMETAGFEVIASSSNALFVRTELADVEIRVIAKKERLG